MDDGSANAGAELDKQLADVNAHAVATWRLAVRRARGAAIAHILLAIATAAGGSVLLGLAAWQLFTLRSVPSSAVALSVAGVILLLGALRWGLDNRHYENAMLGIGAASASYAIFLFRLAMARELVRKAAEEPANIDRMQELDKLLRQIDQDTHSALGGAPKSLDDLFNQLS